MNSNCDNISVKQITMKAIKFKKDGSNRIKIGNDIYNPKTLHQLLNITTAFYAKLDDEDKDGNKIQVDGTTTEWFNYKGLTYIKYVPHWSKNL